MSIELKTKPTSPSLSLSAPGGLRIFTFTDISTGTTFDISYEDMALAMAYCLFVPEYSTDDPRYDLIAKLKTARFSPGRNGGMIKLLQEKELGNN